MPRRFGGDEQGRAAAFARHPVARQPISRVVGNAHRSAAEQFEHDSSFAAEP